MPHTPVIHSAFLALRPGFRADRYGQSFPINLPSRSLPAERTGAELTRDRVSHQTRTLQTRLLRSSLSSRGQSPLSTTLPLAGRSHATRPRASA
jgi:hypothetical protein